MVDTAALNLYSKGMVSKNLIAIIALVGVIGGYVYMKKSRSQSKATEAAEKAKSDSSIDG